MRRKWRRIKGVNLFYASTRILDVESKVEYLYWGKKGFCKSFELKYLKNEKFTIFVGGKCRFLFGLIIGNLLFNDRLVSAS